MSGFSLRLEVFTVWMGRSDVPKSSNTSACLSNQNSNVNKKMTINYSKNLIKTKKM